MLAVGELPNSDPLHEQDDPDSDAVTPPSGSPNEGVTFPCCVSSAGPGDLPSTSPSPRDPGWQSRPSASLLVIMPEGEVANGAHLTLPPRWHTHSLSLLVG